MLCVIAPVMFTSVALGDDLSRMNKSPPDPVMMESVGFPNVEIGRFT